MSNNSDQGPGWIIRKAKTAFETPWFRIRDYDTVAPTGKAARYGLVSFKNLAVGVLPLEPNGDTYLVGQHRFATGQYSWELPEGGCPINQDPLETAKRELSEEIAMKAENWTLLFADRHMSNSTTDERATAYIALGLSTSDLHSPDETEVLKKRRVPVGEVLQMIVNGEIRDVFSLAIMMTADHLFRTEQLPAHVADAYAKGLSWADSREGR